MLSCTLTTTLYTVYSVHTVLYTCKRKSSGRGHFGKGNAADMVGSLKMNTTLEYSTRVVQEGDRRCKKSTLNDLAYLTPLRIPLMNPVIVLILRSSSVEQVGRGNNDSEGRLPFLPALLHKVRESFYFLMDTMTSNQFCR